MSVLTGEGLKAGGQAAGANLKKPVRVLATDLDGTLTDSQKRLSAATIEAIHRAQARGVQIVLASGRPLVGIRALAEQLEMKQRGGYILAFNGAQLLEVPTGRKLISMTIEPQYYREIYEIARDIGQVSIVSYQDDRILSETPQDPYVQKESICCGVPVQKTDDLLAQLREPVHKFLLPGEPHRLARAADYLRRQFAGVLNIFYSEPYFLEVVPVGVQKAAALETLLGQLRVSGEELMACGDGLNDLEMLSVAGVSVAMANACGQAKEKALYVTASNDEDGVARAIEKFILS